MISVLLNIVVHTRKTITSIVSARRTATLSGCDVVGLIVYTRRWYFLKESNSARWDKPIPSQQHTLSPFDHDPTPIRNAI